MIKIIDKHLVIPKYEEIMAPEGDKNSCRKLFILDRNYQGIDLAELDFKLDLKKSDMSKGIVNLDKTIDLDNIILTWIISDSETNVAGPISVQVRGILGNTVVWKSLTCDAFQVPPSINATQAFPSPLPTEFEQMESRVTAIQTDVLAKHEEIQVMFNENGIKKYGVRRAIGQSSPILERVWDSVDLVANVGVDSEIVRNDFDSIYPFSHIRECNISVVNGEIVVNAYKGEPTFAVDGSNGNVAVEVPLFYEAPHFNNDGYEYWGVSGFPISGWNVNPDFIGSNGQILQKVYYAKYISGLVNINNSDSIVSISGVPVEFARSRTTFRTLAKQSNAALVGLPYHDIISTLFTVEFATLNSQSIMSGATSLSYTNAHRPVISETNTNRVILPNSHAAMYVVGGYISIGTSYGGGQIAKNRRITSITQFDLNNMAIAFDSSPVSILTTHYIYSAPWLCGATDNIVASSGSIVSNTSGKYPCKYRGLENPWGNLHQWLDGINLKDYRAWICEDSSNYADDIFDYPYKKLNYINTNKEGYTKETGNDSRYPWARLPILSGAGSTTFYSDYYYPNTANRALYYGGAFNSGVSGGLWYFGAGNFASYFASNIGSRLTWKMK